MAKNLLGSSFLTTILSIFSCTPEPHGAPLVVETAPSGTECNITVNHERVTSQQLRQVAVSGKGQWAIVRMRQDTPYRCVGAVVLILQQAGLTKIKTVTLLYGQ